MTRWMKLTLADLFGMLGDWMVWRGGRFQDRSAAVYRAEPKS